MSQHGYMRHMATHPLVLEIGQKLCLNYPNLTTLAPIPNTISDYRQRSRMHKFALKTLNLYTRTVLR